MKKNSTSDASISIDQLKKYAKDLADVYSSEKEQRKELKRAHQQLIKYADALNQTILELKDKNIKLEEAYRELSKTHKRVMKENVDLKNQLDVQYQIVGESEEIKKVIDSAVKVANSKATVLIEGESGTGKELVARLVHKSGSRKSKPFVVVNCGAIPETLMEAELFGHEKGAFTGALFKKIGLFEAAHGGTIFLDEIGEMSQAMQVKFLRVLQEGTLNRIGSSKPITVDVRVISATNKDLENMTEEGKFREDLFYRINIVKLKIPPLRERRKDIKILAKHFLEKVNLASDLNKYPHELSGGMRQRVAIAQSLIMKPKILLMDEPFGALDPSTRQSMQLFLLELWEELGMTIFFVTHDLHEAVFLGTRIIVLSHQYLDDRGDFHHVKRGAKIIADHPLPVAAKSVDVKKTAAFGELIEEIRLEVDARHKKHVKDFNLKHPFSWRTLREEELDLKDKTQ